MASALKDELDRLKNSVYHLERSNRELQAELANERDQDYQQAIGENIVLLAKQRARIASLEEELLALEGGGAPAMQDMTTAATKGGEKGEEGMWL